MVNKRSDVVINFKALFNGLDRGLDKNKRKLREFGDEARTSGRKLDSAGENVKGLSDDFERMGSSIDRAGNTIKTRLASAAKTLAAFGVASTVALGIRSATQAFVEFEQQLSDISTLIQGDSTEAVEQLGDGILELQRRVPKDPRELGAAAYSILSAGITDADEALAALDASARLAVAGLGTTEQSTNLLTSAINAFAQEGKTADEIANSLFLAVANGKTTVAELSQGFGSVAGQVAATGIRFNDFISTVAALTTVGLPASQAYTQLRAAIAGATRETEQSTRVFNALGAESFRDLIQQSGSLAGALQEIRAEVGDNDAELLKLFGSVEAVNAVISISDVVGDSYAATLQQMETNTEALNEAFDKQTSTLKSQIQLLKNGLQATFIQLGSEILPQVTEVLQDFTGASEESKEGIDGLTVAIKLLGAAFTGVFQTIVIAATLLRTGVISVFTAIEAATKLVTGGFITLATGIGRTFEGLITFFNSSKERVGGSLEAIFQNPLQAIELAFVRTINFIIDKLNVLPGAVESVIGILPDKVKETLNLQDISLQLPKLEEPVNEFTQELGRLAENSVSFTDAFDFSDVGDGINFGLDEASKGFSRIESAAQDSAQIVTRALGRMEDAGNALTEALFDPNASENLRKQRQNTARRLQIEEGLQDDFTKAGVDSINEQSEARSGAAEKAEEELKDLSNLSDSELKALGKEAEKAWLEYEKGVQGAEKAIDKLDAKQQDLLQGYADELRDLNAEFASNQQEVIDELAGAFVENSERIKEIQDELSEADTGGRVGALIQQLEQRQEQEQAINSELNKRLEIEARGDTTFGISGLRTELEFNQQKQSALELQIESELERLKAQSENTSEVERQIELLRELSNLQRENADASAGIGTVGGDLDSAIEDAREEADKTEAQRLVDRFEAERAIFDERKAILEALRAGEEINLEEINDLDNLKLAEREVAKLESIELLKQAEIDKIEEVEAEFLESLKVVEAEELASILRRKGAYDALIANINEAIRAYERLDAINESRRNSEPPRPQIPVFHDGGEVSLPTNEGMALLQDKEFVVKASAAQANLPLLNAINAGQSLSSLVQAAAPRNFGAKMSSVTQSSSSSTTIRNDEVNINVDRIDDVNDLFDNLRTQRRRQF